MTRPRILVVEDVEEERAALRAVLSAQDWEVLTAANGLDGVRMALAEAPDLIVSDVLMPEMNGYHLCRFLKDTPQHAHTPIALLTGLGQQVDRFWGDQSGADLYLVKSGNWPEVISALSRLLERTPAGACPAGDRPGRKPGIGLPASLVNAQVLDLMDRLLRETTLRAAVGRLGRQSNSLSSFLEEALELLSRITRFDLAAILLDSEGVHILATRGDPSLDDDALLKRLAEPLGLRASSPDELERHHSGGGSAAGKGPVTACRVRPLEAHGRVIGSMATLRHGEGPNLSVTERHAFDLFAVELASLAALEGNREAIARKNRELIELNRMKDQLSELLVHDVKNAAFAISLVMDVLALDLDSQGPEHALLIEARNGCKLLTDLMVGLLDVHKLEEARLSLKLVPLDLQRVAREAAALYESRARRRGVSFVIGELPQAHADNDLVRRVLSNLIGNAVKVTSRGTVTIGARRVAVDGSAPMIELSVEDTGSGLSPEAVDCLFQKYGPAKLGNASEATGTPVDRGLGLYFCRLAIEAHGGRIWAESRQGQGSRFLFTLPAEAGATGLPGTAAVAPAELSIG